MLETRELLYNDGLDRSSEICVHALDNTRDLLRRDFAIETPPSFFEGVFIAVPLSLFFWSLIYLAFRAIFF